MIKKRLSYLKIKKELNGTVRMLKKRKVKEKY